MNAVNSIEFGRAFNNMLMRRLDDPVTLAQLMESEAYSDAQQEYDAIYEAVFSGDSVDAASIQALLNATRALHDMELDYLYRTGIQDGMLMLMPDFRTIGVE
jgi:DNA-binding FadR family transcriptional regulator